MIDDKIAPSEITTPVDNSTDVAADAPALEPIAPQLTAGQMLQTARQASGMHIATLSMALKVSVKKLEALEANDWGQLPDAVFVRALATSICRHIKTDSAPILAALPQTAQAKLMDDQSSKGLNQTFRAAGDPKASLLRVPISMPMMMGAMVLLLAAVVLIFLPDMIKKQDAKKIEVVEIQLPALAVKAPVLVPSEAASAPTATIAVPSVVSPSALPATSASLASAPVAPSAPSSTLTPTPSGSILRMTAKGQVWVEVKDSKGVVLAQRTMQPKEVLNVSGQPPLAVVVGRINEMQAIEVRGKPFSLAGLSPDNVARFEVK